MLFIQSFWEHPAGHAGAAWGLPLTSRPSAAPPHHLGLSSNAISLESHLRPPDLTKTPSLSHTRDNALVTPKSSASFIYFLAYSLPVPSEDAVPSWPVLSTTKPLFQPQGPTKSRCSIDIYGMNGWRKPLGDLQYWTFSFLKALASTTVVISGGLDVA